MHLECIKDLINAHPTTLISTVVVLFLGILYLLLKDKDLPPGPTGLPVLGYWPFLEQETIHIQLQKLQKKYGDVFSFRVAGKLFIHLGTTKVAKEAHVTKSDCFTQRCTEFCLAKMVLNKGILMANGEDWKSLRKFFIQSFREFGLASVKDYMAGPIYDAVNAFVEDLKARTGERVDITTILNVRTSEIFKRMMFNDGEVTEKELEGMLHDFFNMNAIFNGKNMIPIGNVAKYLIIQRFKGFEKAVESHRKVKNHLTKIIRRHEETYCKDNIRDVIDSFIRERRERLEKGDPSSEHFSDEALVSSLIEFVGDGIVSIAIFIGYFIHELLEHPEEQEKIYKELEDVIGRDRQVSLEDRSKLIYTNAFMNEVVRTTDFMTLGIGLECTRETTLNGYRIPKGALTLINIWSCNRDPRTFEDPDVFNPSRYITQPGKPKAEGSIIFGVGKRSCAGEAFTMMEVFLFLTSIIKNFRLERPQGYVKKAFFHESTEVIIHPRR